MGLLKTFDRSKWFANAKPYQPCRCDKCGAETTRSQIALVTKNATSWLYCQACVQAGPEKMVHCDVCNQLIPAQQDYYNVPNNRGGWMILCTRPACHDQYQVEMKKAL